MPAEKEVIVELNKMVLDHSAELSKTAGALVLLEFAIIAHALSIKNVTGLSRAVIAVFLVASLAANAVSIFLGYLSDSTVITAMQSYALSGEWKVFDSTEGFNAWQIVFHGVGILLFLVVFAGYSRVLAKIITEVK